MHFVANRGLDIRTLAHSCTVEVRKFEKEVPHVEGNRTPNPQGIRYNPNSDRCDKNAHFGKAR